MGRTDRGRGKRRTVLQLADEEKKSSFLTRYGCYRPEDNAHEEHQEAGGLNMLGNYSGSDMSESEEEEESSSTQERRDYQPPTQTFVKPQGEIDDKVANFLAEIDALDPVPEMAPMPPADEEEPSVPDEEEEPPAPVPDSKSIFEKWVKGETEYEDSRPSYRRKWIQGNNEGSQGDDKKSSYRKAWVKGDMEFGQVAHHEAAKEADKHDEDGDWPEEPTTLWQQIMDDNTQYNYYWHMETNEVTWEIPAEYTQYLLQQKEYKAKLDKGRKEGRYKGSKPKGKEKIKADTKESEVSSHPPQEKHKEKHSKMDVVGPKLPDETDGSKHLPDSEPAIFGPQLPKDSDSEHLDSSKKDNTKLSDDLVTSKPIVHSSSDDEVKEKTVSRPGILKKSKEDKYKKSDYTNGDSFPYGPQLPDSTDTDDSHRRKSEKEHYQHKSEKDYNKHKSEKSHSKHKSEKDHSKKKRDNEERQDAKHAGSRREEDEDDIDIDIDDIDRELDMALEKKQAKSKKSSGDTKEKTKLSDEEKLALKKKSLVDEMRAHVQVKMQEKKELEAKRRQAIEDLMAQELERIDRRSHHGHRKETHTRPPAPIPEDRWYSEPWTRPLPPPRPLPPVEDLRGYEAWRRLPPPIMEGARFSDFPVRPPPIPDEYHDVRKRSASESLDDAREEVKRAKVVDYGHGSKKSTAAANDRDGYSSDGDEGDKNVHAPREDKDEEVLKVEMKKKEVMKLAAAELAELALSKLEFLEITKKGLSKLQILLIELETRHQDWQAGGLGTEFFLGKLQEANWQLQQYEQSAAPPGWSCHWDRAYRRYFYMNNRSGKSQWDYPDPDDQMDPDPDPIPEADHQDMEEDKDADSPPRLKTGPESELVSSTTIPPGRGEQFPVAETTSSRSSTSSLSPKSSKRPDGGGDYTYTGNTETEASQVFPGEPPPPGTELLLGVPPPPPPPDEEHPTVRNLLMQYGSDSSEDEADMEKEVEPEPEPEPEPDYKPFEQLQPDPEGSELYDPLTDTPSFDVPLESEEEPQPGTIISKPYQYSKVVEPESTNTFIQRPPQLADNTMEQFTAEIARPPVEMARPPVEIARPPGEIARPPQHAVYEETGYGSVVSPAGSTTSTHSVDSGPAVDMGGTSQTIERERKKKKKDKAMSSANLTLKKKNVSSLVMKWQQVKKEVEKEEKHQEEREMEIRRKLEQWKQEQT